MASGYPWLYGYCSLSDVQAWIQSGSWTASATSRPTDAQVNTWITSTSRDMDAVFGGVGYITPILDATTNQPPVAGSELADILVEICAQGTASKVELARRGSIADTQGNALAYANELKKRYQEALSAIQMNTKNLRDYNAASLFAPQTNPTSALFSGGYGINPVTGSWKTPAFTREDKF